jgi:GNAT superfamily N-acetyltransferase
MLSVSARPATVDDLPVLVSLYHSLEDEMVALKPIWALVDGLAEPIETSFERLINASSGGVVVGELEGAVFGFLTWEHRVMLPQAGDERIAAIDLIFTDPEARTVGVGEAMINVFLADAVAAGVQRLDAVAPPGHRHAKNFFESNGFKARRIVMHRDER